MATIFYFSGRGNSLWTAKELAARLGNAKLVRMGDPACTGLLGVDPSEPVGFVTPVIGFGLPISVRRFLKNLPRTTAPTYCFAALTTGGMPAASLHHLKRLLAGNGYSLRAAVEVPFRMKEEDPAIRAAELDALSGAVASRRDLRGRSGSPADRILYSGILHSLARRMIPREDSKFSASDSCDGCGICSRICPAGNIAMEGGRPVWRGRCEQCGACFSWCPQASISGTCLAARTRYHNPEITLPEMLRGA